MTMTSHQRRLHGYFNGAHHLVFNNATMAETVYHMLSTGKTVLEYLLPYTMPDASMDSSARHPPPTCHPGTRLHIGNKLTDWLYNTRRQWNMVWLYGSAGTGKSAVAQTFAECCAEWGRLGAAYFVSRSNRRNKPESIVPSLIYQLAVAVPEYKSIIATKLANDPQLLEKARPVQFRKLIVEPFSILQRQRPRDPIVIILDGLDECKGRDAQLEIIGLITEELRLYPDLPLLWLICSRPEVHLKHAFSRVTYCGREELIIDAECRDDVERYLRKGIAEIKAKYWDVTPPDWPSEDQLKKLVHRVSGLFVLASTVLKHVDNPTRAHPVGQLDDMMAYLENAQAVGSNNPLDALDMMYMQILNDVPHDIFPTMRRILAHSIDNPNIPTCQFSAQILCNLLRLDQHTFYNALSGVHSVIEVPEPEAAVRAPLRFRHTSFCDFLLDPNRSGKFVVDERKGLLDIAKLLLFWHDVDTTHFHTNDGESLKVDFFMNAFSCLLGWYFDNDHSHDSLPGLTWTSTQNRQEISEAVARFAYFNCWDVIARLSRVDVDDDLLSQIYNFDFRYADAQIWTLADWLHRHSPSLTFPQSDTLVRTVPSSSTDFRLLEYFKLAINNGFATPATFPLTWYRPWTREYFFIGHGIKSLVVWITGSDQGSRVHVLNCGQEPTKQMISRYQTFLEDIGWEESKLVRRVRS